MKPSIRRATVADLETLLELMVAFNAFEHIPWTKDAGREPLCTLLADVSLGIVGIVTEEESALGYFVVTWNYDLEWNGRDAFLTELFVVEAARGRGIGRIALEAAESMAVQYGAHALHLMVRHENERAHTMYLRAGYVSPPRAFLTKVFPGVR
jgi:GNAT superfamily N-acetyltransferase